MNFIDYPPYTFDDSSIINGKTAMQIAMCSDSLVPDELSVEVISGDTGKKKLLTALFEWYHTLDGRGYVVAANDLRKFTYGDPVKYYYDGVLQGKFYIRSVERLSQHQFRLEAFSFVGMMASITHLGGIYNGDKAIDVIEDILNLTTIEEWTMDQDAGNVPIYGYLPIASARDNLQQVLFAIGASMMKDRNGNPVFKFLKDLTPIEVSGDRIFIGGKLTYKTPATSVIVTEHSYYKSSHDVEVSLFDNSDGSGTVTNKLVTFDEPCYDLTVHDSLSIISSGPNHAYVTGIGTLTGTKYTHTTKTFSVSTGLTGEPREAKVEKATLISAANSANVAARVRDLESTAEEVACGIVMDTDDIKPGSLISFTDPYGEDTQGIVAKMNITMSGKSKADCTIVKNYIPGHFGNNFKHFDLFSTPGKGTYTAPKTGTIRVVLAQGGQAGEGGQGGYTASCTESGQGGAAGNGGAPGKIFVVDLEVTQGQTFSYKVGDQGMGSAGGDRNGGLGELGEEGEHSTFGPYSSADGAIPQNGYINILTGDVYSEYGLPGVDGGNGGLRDYGQDVTFDGTTWTGGWPLGSGEGRGGGGGAAYGHNGQFASKSSYEYYVGGDGADAEQLQIDATLGSGGRGGNGGGGGGSGGTSRGICWGNAPGRGGYGSGGWYGGFGYILIYS